MESDATHPDLVTKLWVLGDRYKKQFAYGLIAAVIVGVIVAFWLAHKSESQNDANYALSKLTNKTSATAPDASADDLLKLVADYPGTDAAQRAQLLAAGDLFTQGKYDAAQAEYQKFVQQYNSSPLVPQAALGIATCQDAQGKVADALSSYDSLANRYQGQNVVPPAKLAMARLLESQGKFKEAHTTLEDLSRLGAGTLSQEAYIRLQELNAAHPELQPAPVPQSAASALKTAVPTQTLEVPKSTTPAPATTNKAP